MELPRDPILELEGFPRSLRLTNVLEASGGAGLSGMGDGSSASRWCNLSKSVSDRCCIGWRQPHSSRTERSRVLMLLVDTALL